MSVDDIRWASETGSLIIEPPDRIKNYGYTTSNGQIDGTPEYPVLQWDAYWRNRVYENINNLSNLISAGGGSGGGSGGGGGGSGGGGGTGVNVILNGDFTGGYINWDCVNGQAEFVQNSNPDAMSGYTATWTPSATDSTLISGSVNIPIRIENKVGAIAFNYQTTSDKFMVSVYEVGTPDVLLVSYPLSATTGSTWMDFSRQVGLPDAGSDIYVKFTCPSTDGTSDSITLSNVQCGTSGAVAEGAIITDWENFTPDINWTSSKPFYGQMRRVGDSAEFRFGVISATITPSSSERLLFTLPEGLTFDYNGSYTYSNLDSNCFFFWDGTDINYKGFGFSSNSIAFVDPENKNQYITDSLVSAGTVRARIYIRIPIVEWQGQGTTTYLKADEHSQTLAGEVIDYAGSTTPNGWLDCDGSAISQTDYPDLYGAIGDTYNTAQYVGADGAIGTYAVPSAGQFRVPDYRNVYTTSDSSNGVGTILDDTTAVNGLAIPSSGAHEHSEARVNGSSNSYVQGSNLQRGTGTTFAGLSRAGNNQSPTSLYIPVYGSNHTHLLSGDAQTRPKSVIVKKIIRCWNNSANAIGAPKADADTYGMITTGEDLDLQANLTVDGNASFGKVVGQIPSSATIRYAGTAGMVGETIYFSHGGWFDLNADLNNATEIASIEIPAGIWMISAGLTVNKGSNTVFDTTQNFRAGLNFDGNLGVGGLDGNTDSYGCICLPQPQTAFMTSQFGTCVVSRTEPTNKLSMVARFAYSGACPQWRVNISATRLV